MAEEKRVPVYIPEDSLNEWERAKTVTINGVIYSIPVGETVEVPESVALVVNEWLANNKKLNDERKKRNN